VIVVACHIPRTRCSIPLSVRVRPVSGEGTPSAVNLRATSVAGTCCSVVMIRLIRFVDENGNRLRELEEGEIVRKRGNHVMWLPGPEDELNRPIADNFSLEGI
jgi:hypothetical protein